MDATAQNLGLKPNPIRITDRRRVVHWAYGDRAYCGTPGVGSDLLLTESYSPDDDDVTCKRCARKWGSEAAR